MEKIIIEKFNTDGSGHAKIGDKIMHIWNALPNETVEYEIVKKDRRHIEAIARNILETSKDRIKESESHFTSCSPWQILSFDAEQKYKKEIALEIFKTIPEIQKLFENTEVYSDNNYKGYRTKMEYHIYTDDDNNFHLGMFGRTEKKKIPIGRCILATDALNETAEKIIRWLDEIKFPRPLLKTIIVRANRNGDTIAALFTKTKEIEPLINNPFQNLTIYYSEPKSPASVATETLLEATENTLKETLLDKVFSFGVMSFFQINAHVFEEALRDIANFVPDQSDILDFYSGVGTIGISLKEKVNSITMVEENTDAVNFAKENIKQNNIENAEAHLGQAHDLREFISKEKILIVDPPRGGLHPKVIKKILQECPPRIIYLSCNIESQARDLLELKNVYKPIFTRLYNFFPRTPHVESLIVLDKID